MTLITGARTGLVGQEDWVPFTLDVNEPSSYVCEDSEVYNAHIPPPTRRIRPVLDETTVFSTRLSFSLNVERFNLRGVWNGTRRASSGSNAGLGLGQVVKSNKKIKSMILNQNKLSDFAIIQIADGLKENKVLEKLEMVTACSSLGASMLVKALHINEHLSTLNLSFNDLGSSTGLEIAEMLTKNCTLIVLDLQKTRIDAPVGAAIGRALLSNTSLTDLNLAQNHLMEVGAAGIAQALVVNHTLTVLNLRDNCLDGTSEASLAEAVKVNSGLQELNVRYNPFGGTTGSELAIALLTNKTIHKVFSDHWARHLTEQTPTSDILLAALDSNESLVSLGLNIPEDEFPGPKLASALYKIERNAGNVLLRERSLFQQLFEIAFLNNDTPVKRDRSDSPCIEPAGKRPRSISRRLFG